MGDSLSIPEKWKHDPNYPKVRDTLKTADKDVRRLVDGFIEEQDRLYGEHSKLQKNNEELQTKNDEYGQHQSKLQKEIKKLREDIHKLRKESKPHHNPKMPLVRQRSNSGNPDTDKIVEDFLQEQENLTEINKKLTKENESLKRECQILSNEKESALSRLSKIAGIQLTKGNSDIADLGDVNRPTKLAEKWSNLYTDEWTDAYDELGMNKTNKNENFKFEKELCSIVLTCYNMCLDIERKQMKDIRTHTWDIACCLHQQPDQLVSAAQTTQYDRVIKGDVAKKAATMNPQDAKAEGRQFNVKMLAIQKCMEELIQIVHERRKYDKQLLKYVKQEAVRHFEKYTKPGSKGHIIRYVEHCTELCWSMVIKNPQMVLVHNQMEGKPFDRDMFSVYTKKGAVVDFVIWPALILHQNGPILSKGTVQCKDNHDKSEIAQGKTDISETIKESITERSVQGGNSSMTQTFIVHTTDEKRVSKGMNMTSEVNNRNFKIRVFRCMKH